VRFRLFTFERSLRLKALPIVASQAMDTARRLRSLEPEFLFSLLAMQAHRRIIHFAPDGGKRYSAVANIA
jgi:hypothetical protein